MNFRTTDQLSEKLRTEHALTNSWNRVASVYGIITPKNKPNPRLAQMIAGGYDPKLSATRYRLHLFPICPECHQKMPKPPRVVPNWLKQATENLRQLERPEPAGGKGKLQ